MAELSQRPRCLARNRPNLFRMVLCLAVLQCVFWLSMTTEAFVYDIADSLFPPEGFGYPDGRLTSGILTFVVAGAYFWIWRRVVVWTLGKVTAMMFALLLVSANFIFWIPVVDVGCTSDALCMSQSITLLGGWMWVSVWIWWGISFARDVAKNKLRPNQKARIKSLLASFGLYPFLVGGFVMTILITENHVPFSESIVWCVNGFVWSLVAMFVWLWIWKSRVNWTRPKRKKTLILGIICCVASVLCQLFSPHSDWGTWMKAFCPLLMFGLWVAFTCRFWSGKADDPSISCPQCGYNLSGLYSTRCPECGHAVPLGSLLKDAYDRHYGGLE